MRLLCVSFFNRSNGRGSKDRREPILGSPPTVSTRRVELTTSKVTVSEEVLVLAKSRSEEGSQNSILPRGIVIEEHALYLS